MFQLLGNDSNFPAELFQVFGDLFDAGVGDEMAVDIEGGAFGLAGFLFDFAEVGVVDGDVADFVGNGEFVEKADDGGGPGATAFTVQCDLHPGGDDNTLRDVEKELYREGRGSAKRTADHPSP